MTNEDDPSPACLKRVNHGYQLSKHEPALLDNLLQANSTATSNEYIKAARDGKSQSQQEELVNEMKAVRERQTHSIKKRR